MGKERTTSDSLTLLAGLLIILFAGIFVGVILMTVLSHDAPAPAPELVTASVSGTTFAKHPPGCSPYGRHTDKRPRCRKAPNRNGKLQPDRIYG